MPEPGRSRPVTGVRALGRLLLGHIPAFRNARLQDLATHTLHDGSDRQAWVVAVVNGSLRARQALTYLLYLRPRSTLSRLRFAFAERAHPRHTGPGPGRRLSVLCPTRGRVRRVDTFLGSLQRTAVDPGRVEALFYVDADDPDVAAYRALFARASRRYSRLGRCVLQVGEPVGVPRAWNALAAAASGDLLLMANDDQLYVDHGWDVRLDARAAEVAAEHADGVCCLYFDAGQYPEGGCDFPIVSRSWYEALGYFVPTIFQQWEVERWVFDLARRIGRLHAVPEVLVEHRHYQDYKAPFDQTYQLHRMTRDKSFADHALFLRTAEQRARDAALLRRAIDGVGPARRVGEFWFGRYLEENHPKIRAEVDTVPGWDEARLFQLGQRCDDVCAMFPVTTGIVAAIPEATTLGPGVVSLSRLRPGARAAHRSGRADGSLTVYLGIRVPERVTVRVGGREFACAEGACLVVEAGAEQELTHAGAGESVVLVLDVRDQSRDGDTAR